jgi:hypothetical protein
MDVWKLYPYNHLETHEEACGHRLITCSGCQKKVIKKDFQGHHSKCPLVSLTCPECAAVYKRQIHESHTETVCLRVQLHQLRDQRKQNEDIWSSVSMQKGQSRRKILLKTENRYSTM